MVNTIETVIAKQDITELSYQYMRGLDRWDSKSIEAVFFDDAYCEYGFFNGSAKEFIVYAMTALQDHQSNHHMVGNILIDIEGDEAFGEVYFNAYHKLTTSNGLEDMIIAGRYLDRYEKRQGVWKIAYRSEVVDWSHSRPNNDPYFEAVPNTLFGQRSNDAAYDRAARYKTSN